MTMVSDRGLPGLPPLPREHGAWFMLYMPMLAVLVGVGADFVRAGLFALVVTGAFLGQHTAGLMLRKRSGPGAEMWLGIYGVLVVAAGGWLVGGYGLTDLVWVGAPAAGTMGWQLLRSRFSPKRVDRSVFGELVAVAGLTLTAPGAFVVAAGGLPPMGVGLWGLFVLYFGSSVLFVKMHIQAARYKSELRFADRIRLGSGLLVYHGMLVGLLLAFYGMDGPGKDVFLLGFAPVLLRAFVGWALLSNGLPNFKRVGLIESAYTLWFSGCVAVSLRTALI